MKTCFLLEIQLESPDKETWKCWRTLLNRFKWPQTRCLICQSKSGKNTPKNLYNHPVILDNNVQISPFGYGYYGEGFYSEKFKIFHAIYESTVKLLPGWSISSCWLPVLWSNFRWQVLFVLFSQEIAKIPVKIGIKRDQIDARLKIKSIWQPVFNDDFRSELKKIL